jgi:hypothetical protein
MKEIKKLLDKKILKGNFPLDEEKKIRKNQNSKREILPQGKEATV